MLKEEAILRTKVEGRLFTIFLAVFLLVFILLDLVFILPRLIAIGAPLVLAVICHFWVGQTLICDRWMQKMHPEFEKGEDNVQERVRHVSSLPGSFCGRLYPLRLGRIRAVRHFRHQVLVKE